MDIRQIRAFLAVADTGTVTRAAELLHVVQPAVTRQIRLLEQELGCALFVRTRLGMQLTEPGNLLIERARRAVRELDIAREEIHPAEAGKLSGVVRIGLLPSSCDLVADALYAAMHQAYPYIQISLSVDYSDPLFKSLISGELDATLLYNPSASAAPALDIEPLLREPLCLIGLPSKIDARKKKVPVSALARSPLILPGAHHRLRSLVEHACAVHGVDIAVAAETHALPVQKSLVVQGYGMSVLPRVAVRDELDAATLSAAFIDGPEFIRTIALAQPAPAARQTSQAVRCTARVLRDCIRQLVSDGHWLDAEWISNLGTAHHV
ncbi:LysR family transcriptional regulator [Paraburkholderia sp. D15]|uniref:LysR family transcriptional regulator n=1 Tax=Paraburkholderia sp. D15 TaxID=2880218 RepID=UPI002478E3EF|nr:LysR family transcriptional regulator [Paraburkholderia sp. D15]WGS52349.1 LysR family transcriptional regulator [Paraburkholderia sp. D15]